MKRIFGFVLLMLTLTVMTFSDVDTVLSGGPVKFSKNSITKTLKAGSKFFDVITITNNTDKKLKLWTQSKIFYVDEEGEKHEIVLKKKTSWNLSPVIGVGVQIGSGGRVRTGSGVGVEVSPDGRDAEHIINIESGINFKPNEEKKFAVNFNFSDLRLKSNRNVAVTQGKLEGEIIFEDRSKTYSDIIIPIEINIEE